MGRRGPKSAAPGGYGSITAKGYRRIRHEGRARMEHDVVWETHYGPIPKGWVVHHRDENKLNNAIENLVLLTALVHKRIHSGCQYVHGSWQKPCRLCGEMKDIGAYYERPVGVSPWCKSCIVKRSVRNRIQRRTACHG